MPKYQFVRQELESFRDELVARIEAKEDRLRMVAMHVGHVVAARRRLVAMEAAIKDLAKWPPTEGGTG